MTSLMSPVSTLTVHLLPDNKSPPPEPIEVEGTPEYKVEEVMDSHLKRGKLNTLSSGPVIPMITTHGNAKPISKTPQTPSPIFTNTIPLLPENFALISLLV